MGFEMKVEVRSGWKAVRYIVNNEWLESCWLFVIGFK